MLSGAFVKPYIGVLHMGLFAKFFRKSGSSSDTNQVQVQQTTTVSTDDFDSVDIQNEVKMDYNDSVSVTTKESANLSEDSITYGAENTVQIETDTGKKTAKSAMEASFGENNFRVKQRQEFGQKFGNVDAKIHNEMSAGHDGKRFTVGQSMGGSAKVGTDDGYVKATANHSTKVGANYVGAEDSYGLEAKSGPVDYGVKQTTGHSRATEENARGEKVASETETKKTELSSGVDTGKGVKVKNSVEVEQSEKITEDKNSYTEERKTSIHGKTRMEVDEAQAGKGAAVYAEMFNAVQEAKESVLKDAFSQTETKKYAKDGNTEGEADEKANEEQVEADQKENAEKASQAQAENEKSVQEQVEEDNRVHEEMERDSEELMDEHENAMEVDREEYAEELEDYSYEADDDVEKDWQADFGEEAQEPEEVEITGESADNDYDYGYGY